MAIRSPAAQRRIDPVERTVRIGHARQVVEGAGAGLQEALELVIGPEAASSQERRDRGARIR